MIEVPFGIGPGQNPFLRYTHQKQSNGAKQITTENKLDVHGPEQI